jgi:hypothetical protein
MGLFGKKQETCPICDAGISKGGLMMHNLGHAVPATDGPGYMWKCACGEKDGVWDAETGAAAGLTMHMSQRHGLTAV